ncbi:hypothetical protein FOZ62_014563, partial [Perkinsus olseni]
HGEVDPEILERIARLNQWFNTNSSKWGHSGRRSCHDVKAVVLMTPRGALRKVLEARCGGLKKAYHHLDPNGNGQLSRVEFEGALKALGVPWEDATGVRDFSTLCRLLGEKEGEVMLSEVLGVRPQPTQWKDMTEEQKWHHYARGVNDMLPSSAFLGPPDDSRQRPKRRLSGDRTAAWKANALSPYTTLAKIRAVETSRHFVKMRFRSGDHSVS